MSEMTILIIHVPNFRSSKVCSIFKIIFNGGTIDIVICMNLHSQSTLQITCLHDTLLIVFYLANEAVAFEVSFVPLFLEPYR